MKLKTEGKKVEFAEKPRKLMPRDELVDAFVDGDEKLVEEGKGCHDCYCSIDVLIFCL